MIMNPLKFNETLYDGVPWQRKVITILISASLPEEGARQSIQKFLFIVLNNSRAPKGQSIAYLLIASFYSY